MRILFILLLTLPGLLRAQHKIEGTFSPAKDFTYAFLYRASASGATYVDRAKVDDEGKFVLQMEQDAPAGIYKIVYGLPQEEHNFDLIYSGKEDVVLNFSLETGLEFKESNENKLWASYTHSMEMINRAIGNFYAKNSEDKTALMEIFKTLNETQNAFEKAAADTMVLQFIKANAPYIPTGYEDVATYSTNLKNTYLQHVDFNNPLLQSSEFLIDRVMAFVFGMSPQPDADYYKSQINSLVNYIGPQNDEIKMALLRNLWFKMVELEQTEVANYITDHYLLSLAQAADDDLLVSELESYKRTSIGAKAINFPLELTVKGKKVKTTLHDLKLADNYLLIFWNSGCSHCLDQLPQIRKEIKTISPKKLKVIAFATQGPSPEWEREIQKYPDYIHVIDQEEGRYVGHEYGVMMTPTYFLLDKDKKIKYKPADLQDLMEQLEALK